MRLRQTRYSLLHFWHSESQSVIIGLSHLILICYFDELLLVVVGARPSRETTQIDTHESYFSSIHGHWVSGYKVLLLF